MRGTRMVQIRNEAAAATTIRYLLLNSDLKSKVEFVLEVHLPFVFWSRGWIEGHQLVLRHHMRLVGKVGNEDSMLLDLVATISRVANCAKLM